MGGAGSDQIWISASDSYIAGGSLNGNNAFADGGADNDNIHFGSLQNQATIIGGTGSDYIAQTSFNNQQHYAKQVTIYADGVSGETVDDGNDEIIIYSGQIANIDAGDGDDRIRVDRYAAATINGGSGNDYVDLRTHQIANIDEDTGNYNYLAYGGSGNDSLILKHFAWYDNIRSYPYSVIFDGGSGNDSIYTYKSDVPTSDGHEYLHSLYFKGGEGDDSLKAT